MTQHSYTSRLIYYKYPFQANLVITLPLGVEPRRHNSITDHLSQYVGWVKKHCKKKTRINKSWYKDHRTNDAYTAQWCCHFSVCFDSRDDYDGFCTQFNDCLVATRAPANDHHEDLIRSGGTIEVRDKLFYRKYRHKVSFRGGWRPVTRAEIQEFVREQLHDPVKKKKQDYYMAHDCTLYLKENSDLILVKMALSEHIYQNVIVATHAELQTT
jgi:hypothetical protein